MSFVPFASGASFRASPSRQVFNAQSPIGTNEFVRTPRSFFFFFFFFFFISDRKAAAGRGGGSKNETKEHKERLLPFRTEGPRCDPPRKSKKKVYKSVVCVCVKMILGPSLSKE